MKVLHLTDFHFQNTEKNIQNQNKIIQKLIESLKNQKPDLILFSGDLVEKGNNLNHFYEAETTLLTKLCEELSVAKENIIICPGNHDIYRNQELDDVTKAINNLSSNDELDEYVLKNSKRSLIASLDNHKNYMSFAENFYQQHIQKFGDELVEGMYTSHIRTFDNNKVGIVSINSAWRCIDSKTDYGNLKYPIYHIEAASNQIKDCDFKILIMHHPLADFSFWNAFQLEDIIYKEFHMMFTGHTHKKKDSLQLTGGVGIYHCSSSATLTQNNEGNVGYSFIDTNLDSYEISIKKHTFIKQLDKFIEESTIEAEIPVNTEKRKLNRLRTILKNRFLEKSEEADELFLSYKEIKDHSFINLFTEPILKAESQFGQKKENNKYYKMLELLSSNRDFLIIGKDKSGKSAILYKLLLESLANFKSHELIPLYIDCRNYSKNSNKKIDITKILQDFVEFNKRDSLALLSDYKLLLLLDNFTDIDLIETICEFKKTHNNVILIGTTSETLYNSFTSNWNVGLGFTNIYIHDITRTEIRSLANKWPNISEKQRGLLLERIHKLFSQLNIPSNYWTVSLFLWIFEKNSNLNFSNNFQLIELYIDNLLDKDNFILANKHHKIDYEDLKAYLAELAHYLVKDKFHENYFMSYAEWVSFTDSYKKANRRFVAEIQIIVELILEKGIIKKELNDAYTFRLNGVFEYFIGYYLSIDNDFRDLIINDDHFYLSFGNELEICAGFISYDKEFVTHIYNKTQMIFKDLNSQYDREKIDTHLVSKVDPRLKIEDNISKAIKEKLSNPLSDEKQDEIFEIVGPSNDRISEVKQKKYYEWIEPNVDNYEKALFILGRVFRNSKLRNNENLNSEIFSFILDSTCTLAFSLIDELEHHQLIVSNKNNEEELIKLITRFVPLMAQTYFQDAVIQGNLENIVLDKINDLKKSTTENQFKLMILYFSLIDLDLNAYQALIPELISLLKIPVLKSSSVLKLYLYLSLKVNGNKPLQKSIENHIREQEKHIDNDRQRKPEIESKISRVKNSTRNKK